MISEFETRLADVLGSRLPVPVAGAVQVAPGTQTSRLVVSVGLGAPVLDDLLSERPERVPGAAQPRRVVRLRCEVTLDVRAREGVTRADQMRALDQAVFLLGEASFRDGTALLPDTPGDDPGFLIRRMQLVRTEPPALVKLDADGLFWPVGSVGQSGPAITATRLRQAILPATLVPEQPVLVAGGGPAELRVLVGTTGTFETTADGAVAETPFGSVVVSLVNAGGGPGAGTLAGGAAGPDGGRLVPIADGAVTVQYTPPAQSAIDRLVLRWDDNEGGAGPEIGRFRLQVRSA